MVNTTERQYMTDERDPFAGSESAPAISFKDAADGTIKTIIADGPAKQLQQRVFGTDGELAFWPAKNGVPGNPKMAAVVSGVDLNGEPVSLWAALPGDLASKIAAAQNGVAPKYRIKDGDRIDVKLVTREPSGKGNPKSVFAVKITPGAPPAQSDPFGDDKPPF